MSNDCLPSMIVENFRGDEIHPETKKRISGGDSNLTQMLKRHDLLNDVPNMAVEDGTQFRVLDNISGYLNEMDVGTAVIETEYVDQDYLDDYVRFYSRCYVTYPRRCRRVHFFKREYKRAFIQELLTEPDPSKIDENDSIQKGDAFAKFAKDYLGFVVIRPLATGLVGRTCLKSYPEEHGRRYTALCDVKVSFFGRELTVRCMPFIQQDAATAVCAGCALWSTFMVTSQLFQHRRYCPGCITELATKHGLSDKRNFPNGGLFVRDMAYAIRGVGLEPINLVCGGDTPVDRVHQLGSIYAYLSAGLPIVLTGALLHANDSVEGEHAVVVNGYHLPERHNAGTVKDSYLLSDRIAKIYVHDDQIGPGARMINPIESTLKGGKKILTWTTDWEDNLVTGPVGQMRMEVHALLIPTYHKIRVDYEMIFKQVEQVERGICETISKIVADPAYERYVPMANRCKNHEWDIRLLTAKAYKREIRQDGKSMDATDKLTILGKGYPRFVWDIALLVSGERHLRFVVDATDSGQNLNVLDVLTYQKEMTSLCRTMSSNEWPGANLKNTPLIAALIEKTGGVSGATKTPPIPHKPAI